MPSSTVASPFRANERLSEIFGNDRSLICPRRLLLRADSSTLHRPRVNTSGPVPGSVTWCPHKVSWFRRSATMSSQWRVISRGPQPRLRRCCEDGA